MWGRHGPHLGLRLLRHCGVRKGVRKFWVLVLTGALASQLQDESPKDVESSRAHVRLVVLVPPVFIPSSWLKLRLTINRWRRPRGLCVPPRWEGKTAQRAGPAGRGLLLLPRHLICAVVGSLPSSSLPQGRIENKPERQKPLRGHPLTAVPNRPDCAPRASASVCVCLSVAPFLTASTRRDSFEPVCQDKLTSPIYAPTSASGPESVDNSEDRFTSPVAHGPLLRARNGHFWGLHNESLSVTSTLILQRETHTSKEIHFGHPPGIHTGPGAECCSRRWWRALPDAPFSSPRWARVAGRVEVMVRGGRRASSSRSPTNSSAPMWPRRL